MRNKLIMAVLAAAVLTVGAVSAFALDFGVQNNVNNFTGRFFEVESNEAGDVFTMESEDGALQIKVNDDTTIHFEDYVPLSDDSDDMTLEVREVLFGRTLVEVLEGRNMFVTHEDGAAISIRILFETAVTLPIEIDDDQAEVGYVGIVTLPAEITWDDPDTLVLNGEIVVNGEMLANAPHPFLNANNVVMVPLRVIAEALDHEVTWDGVLGSVRIGVARHIWIGNTEAHVGRMAPIELSAAPVVIDGVTFVSMDFFRSVMSQTAYVFEGQFVVETYSDMM